MGTIVPRLRKDGSTAYMAQIAVMRDGKSMLRETKTFDREPAARAWIKKREAALAKPGALDAIERLRTVPTLGDSIRRYVAENEKEIGRTKAQVLEAILTHDIADLAGDAITTAHLVDYAKFLVGDRAPQTVGNYFSHLGAVYSVAETAWDHPLDDRVLKKATKAGRKLGYIGKSKKRDRRPTLDEMNRIMAHFALRDARKNSEIPMTVIVGFAVFSTRRQEEITRIAWKDLDVEGGRVLVRDMKHPGDKDGNDTWCNLDPVAMQIITAMPKVADEIFPFNHRSVSAAFTNAMHVLDIQNLHFHDLRHDGVSRLFEIGLGIPQVTAHSGHRDWKSLQRYTHLRQTGDKYAGWEWIAKITSA